MSEEVVQNVQESQENAQPPKPVISPERQKYIERMQALGAKFDEYGNFVGWADIQPAQYSQSYAMPQQTDDDYDDYDNDLNKIESLKSKIVAEIAPSLAMTNVMQAADRLGPSYAKYRNIVENLVAKNPMMAKTVQEAEALFVWARGQAADVEIAEAKKQAMEELMREQQKITAGASTGGDGATTGAARQEQDISPDMYPRELVQLARYNNWSDEKLKELAKEYYKNLEKAGVK